MNYPYIQNKTKIENTICEVCKETKQVNRIEWRVDWFQGNCEFENICGDCLHKRNNEEQKKKDAYYKKMEPIWEKERIESENREKVVIKTIESLGLDIKKYDNGQWTIGGIIDWWTTTGTVIHRKSGNRHHWSFHEPLLIKKWLEDYVKR